MRVFFFLCVQRFYAMVHWPKIQSNLFVRAFSQLVRHKVNQPRETNSCKHRVNVAIMKCNSSIDLLWIAHNETSKIPECACLRVALRHIWQIHLIVVSLRAFGVRNIVLKHESTLAKMFFVFCAVVRRHIHKVIGFIHVLPKNLRQGNRLAPG